jgi:hypothetical protein
MERMSDRRLASARTSYPAEDDVPEPGLSVYPRAEAVSFDGILIEPGLNKNGRRQLGPDTRVARRSIGRKIGMPHNEFKIIVGERR